MTNNTILYYNQVQTHPDLHGNPAGLHRLPWLLYLYGLVLGVALEWHPLGARHSRHRGTLHTAWKHTHNPGKLGEIYS